MKGVRRILSVDGSGAGGLASLIILRRLMTEISKRGGVEDPQPSDYFDLICVDSRGLIAIMLGTLGMVFFF